MSNKEREILKEKIKRAIKFSSQKLIEKKKALGQKLVISEEGKIRVIEPYIKKCSCQQHLQEIGGILLRRKICGK